jgi:hypothetical protein
LALPAAAHACGDTRSEGATALASLLKGFALCVGQERFDLSPVGLCDSLGFVSAPLHGGHEIASFYLARSELRLQFGYLSHGGGPARHARRAERVELRQLIVCEFETLAHLHDPLHTPALPSIRTHLCASSSLLGCEVSCSGCHHRCQNQKPSHRLFHCSHPVSAPLARSPPASL